MLSARPPVAVKAETVTASAVRAETAVSGVLVALSQWEMKAA